MWEYFLPQKVAEINKNSVNWQVLEGKPYFPFFSLVFSTSLTDRHNIVIYNMYVDCDTLCRPTNMSQTHTMDD